MPSSFRPNRRGPVLIGSHQGPTRKARRGVLRSNTVSDLRDVRSDTYPFLPLGTDDPDFSEWVSIGPCLLRERENLGVMVASYWIAVFALEEQPYTYV